MKMEPSSPPPMHAAGGGSSLLRGGGGGGCQYSRASSVGSGHTPSSSAPNTGSETVLLSRSLSQSDIGNHPPPSILILYLFSYMIRQN